MRHISYQKGTTLIETLIASAIFVVISIAIYQLYAKVITFSGSIRATTIATQIAGEQMEFIRNLQYSDVGILNGIPSGIVPSDKDIVRNGATYHIDTTIRNVDFPADGTLGGSPDDLSPADNKLVSILVTCTSCKIQKTVSNTSFVAPKSLETENGNGALVIKAIDANGLPIVGADVSIVNNSISPAVNMTDVTDAYGNLTIVDAPPSTEKYSITVTKSGYSTDQSYQPGAAGNPNPLKPHLTVTANTVTQSTFAIDQTSTISINMKNNLCAVVMDAAGNLKGSKIIGTGPDVLKTNLPFAAASGPSSAVNNVEWDTYTVSIAGTTYDLAGSIPTLPLTVAPNTSHQLSLLLKPRSANRLVVAAIDDAEEPIIGASVTVGSTTKVTGPNSITQTNWSGGGGQTTYVDGTKFSSESNTSYIANDKVTLLLNEGLYAPTGSLISSTFDFGTATNFGTLSWAPNTQPAAAGALPVRFQLAANNDNATWNFVGPDGTDTTYYSSPNVLISSTLNGNRYLRYKIYLSTADTTVTPSVDEVTITSCNMPGQVDFGGLGSGSYTITVSKTGYTTETKTITISDNHYETVTLKP